MTRKAIWTGAVAVALAVAAAAPAHAQSVSPSAQCPTFRVLHNDQIGSAVFPKGTYAVNAQGVSCGQASQLFSQFLQDYDGKLPGGWRVDPSGQGKASFTQNGRPGFSVALIQGPPPTPPPPSPTGGLCPGNFSVLNNDRIGKLAFPKGSYEILIPRGSIISCGQASNLFRRFLNFPNGRLPKGWRLKAANARFFKPQNPGRKTFRVDPAVNPNSGL